MAMYLGSEIADHICPENGMRGYLKAIDPMTGKPKWQVPSAMPNFCVKRIAKTAIRSPADGRPTKRHGAMTWAQRLKRVFNIDIEICSRCGGAASVIACIEDQDNINRILAHLRRTEQDIPTRPILALRQPSSTNSGSQTIFWTTNYSRHPSNASYTFKRLAISNLRELCYKLSDVVVIIDLQLQRVEDGPPIEKASNLKLHALITMSEIIDYILVRQEITADQVNALVADYNRYEHWTLPTFARIG